MLEREGQARAGPQESQNSQKAPGGHKRKATDEDYKTLWSCCGLSLTLTPQTGKEREVKWNEDKMKIIKLCGLVVVLVLLFPLKREKKEK